MGATQWFTDGGWVLLGLGLFSLGLAVSLARAVYLLRDREARNEARIDRLRRELSGLEQGREDLERLSALDPVTGVWNYRYLQQSLARELGWAARDRRPFALLLLEVDGFADYTAAAGHQKAFGTLRDLAQRLSVEIRSGDTFARYGGDEFVALLPGATGEGAEGVAERLCYAVRKTVAQYDEAASELTLSVGIATFPESGEHAASLVGAADRALAAARAEGGDRWRLARGGEVVLTDYQAQSRSS
ncbi:GGDEF domain-containing protein [Actinospica sp. MGRD01-02]|uniref:GGDEF domain-containing protein n=1 Tax=Actinospica acidithermotolerans TaxID=2828514 RepID=A0A941EHG7_9ACTN|nr:GGDEF domain-containing protein [Actinospica acidithermotolerans]MBR7830478.1 GGDEF domain-containing protein [Actinospica acidithermotolerans]